MSEQGLGVRIVRSPVFQWNLAALGILNISFLGCI